VHRREGITTLAEWTVRTKNHGGSTLAEVRPMGLEFDWNIGSVGPSSIGFNLSLADPSVGWNFAIPYATEWELWNHDYGEPLIAGLMTGRKTRKGSNLLELAGKCYLHYLELRHYPFNPLLPNAFLGGTAVDDQGIAYQANKDVALVIGDVLTKVNARANSLEIFYDAFEMGIVNGYRIELGDTESIYDKLSTWSQATPGFEFEVDWQKRLFTYADQKFLVSSIDDPGQAVWIFDKWQVPTDVTDVELEDEGPEFTHLLASGAGTATQTMVAMSHVAAEQDYYRLDGTEDYGDVINQKQLDDIANHRLAKGYKPQHNLPFTIRTDNIPDFWKWFEPGLSIWIREDFEVAGINSPWVMNTISCRVDEEGEEVVNFELEEIFDLENVVGLKRG
jgi:hypothetical protein